MEEIKFIPDANKDRKKNPKNGEWALDPAPFIDPKIVCSDKKAKTC